MLRKFICKHGLVSLDPADIGFIEKLFKKDIREKEEGLMLAVLENAVETLAESSYFKRRRSGF
jgi:hypothetical protein